jgi:hypothetical protein
MRTQKGEIIAIRHIRAYVTRNSAECVMRAGNFLCGENLHIDEEQGVDFRLESKVRIVRFQAFVCFLQSLE